MKSHMYKEYTGHLQNEEGEKEPSLFQVVMHNDEFTPMEFMIEVIERFFYLDRNTAANVMMEARMRGKAVCGQFARDFAETKVSQVIEYARNNEQPLICTLENAV